MCALVRGHSLAQGIADSGPVAEHVVVDGCARHIAALVLHVAALRGTQVKDTTDGAQDRRPSFHSFSCSSLPLTVPSVLLSLCHVSVRSTLRRSPSGLARHAPCS